MKSPFPGMDPYIEACRLWGDFHDSLIGDVKRVISGMLPAKYVARSRERSYIVLVETDIEEDFKEQFIDIYEVEPERRLVTSIELLSPSNKRKGTPGWKKYLRKRQALLLGKANLVEIDLLRGGTRMPMLDPLPASPYYVLVAREERAPYCKVWPAYFDRPLPTIPIPLSKPDPDLSLILQPLVDAIHERSRYGQDIDYTKPLTPPLTAKEAGWLEKRLSEAAAPKPSRGRSKGSRRR